MCINCLIYSRLHVSPLLLSAYMHVTPNMDEMEIKGYLLGNELTSKHFLGVLAYDELPSVKQRKGFYVVNTGRSSTPGIHWIVVLKLNGIIEFFDSLANKPEHYTVELEKYLILNGPDYKMSTKIIQGKSDFCGNYCVIFCYFRCEGYSMSDFLGLFSSNLQKNDKMVNFDE